MANPTASLYCPPLEDDLASPLAFLRWFHRTMRHYVCNEINWEDVRDVMKFVPEVIDLFEAGSNPGE